jgi:hypothetical protein
MTTDGIWKFFLKMKRSEIKYTVATRVFPYFQSSLNPYIAKIDAKIDPTYPVYPQFHIVDITLAWQRGTKKGGGVNKAIPLTGRGGPWSCETSRVPHFLDKGKIIPSVMRITYVSFLND